MLIRESCLWSSGEKASERLKITYRFSSFKKIDNFRLMFHFSMKMRVNQTHL